MNGNWRRLYSLENVYYKRLNKGEFLYLSFKDHGNGLYDIKYYDYMQKDYTKREITEALAKYIEDNKTVKYVFPTQEGYVIMNHFGHYEWEEKEIPLNRFLEVMTEYSDDILLKLIKEKKIVS
ncbi:hypothetical protein [Gottfriedia solisilvae]|uniref:hypothetical protein n=1 Tax=Gottfriedia solisilvae TaxID=1516104 RepID=UPI003D2F21F6